MADLGNAYVNIVPKAPGIEGEISGLLGSAEPAAQKAGTLSGKSLASGIAKGLLAGTAAIAGTVAAVGKGVVSGALQVAEYGDNIDKMSQKMGLSREAYQEWDAIMQHSGTSIDSMQASMKTLANAVEGGNKAFERIGLSLTDVEKMSNEELFAATITGLQNVDNETERTYLAGQLLGRGATELGALLNTSAEDTEAMRQRVHELGGVMSDEAVLSAANFQDSLQDMQTAFSGVKNSITMQFLPGITDVMDGFTSLITGEEGASEQIAAGFSNVLTNVGSVADQLFEIAGQLLPQISGIIIDHLPEIVERGAEIIGKLIVGLIQALPQLIASLPKIFTGIKNAFSGVDWGTLGKQIIDGIINGLKAAASSLWDAMKNIVRKALGTAQDEAEVGSPSKLFADELGHWIPPGIAMGAEQNMAPLNRAMAGIMDSTLADMQRATATPAQSATQSASLERSMAAIANRPVQVGVVLDANARKLLRVVRSENYSETKRTQYNGLAAMA